MTLKRSLPLPARRALLGGTALGCSLMILGAPAQALAANECGADTAGSTQLFCASTYATGISYGGVDALQLTITPTGRVSQSGVHVQGTGAIRVVGQTGAVITADGTAGISVTTTGAAGVNVDTVTTLNGGATGIYVEAGGAAGVSATNVSTNGLVSHGIHVVGGTAPVVVNSTGEIHTEGNNSVGVLVEAEGDVTINVNDIVTKGGYDTAGSYVGASHGIQVTSLTGTTRITADTITTSGNGANGIRFNTSDGGDSGVIVDVGTITANGRGTAGITIDAAGNSTIAVDTVVTSQFEAHGVAASMRGAASIGLDIGSVTTGDAVGVQATTDTGAITAEIETVRSASYGVNLGSESGNITAVIQDVISTGINRSAVSAWSNSGDIDLTVTRSEATRSSGVAISASTSTGDILINATELVVGGEFAIGLYLESASGAIEAHVGSILTTGRAAVGISVRSDNGPVELHSEDITTTGAGGVGIYVDLRDDDGVAGVETVDITSGSITTLGEEATAIIVAGLDGKVTIDSQFIDTTGNLAEGIRVTTEAGDVEIDTDDIITRGADADAVNVQSDDGDIDVASLWISTEGDNSDAISVTALSGDVLIDSEEIMTSGAGSRGIDVLVEDMDQPGGDIVVNSTSILTSGENGTGITVSGRGGKVTIDSGEIATRGAGATALQVDTGGGDIEVHSDSITTLDAAGILLSTFGGDIVVDSGAVSTRGVGADGINAFSQTGAVTIDSETVTSLGAVPDDEIGAAIVAQAGGNVIVRSTGPVVAGGANRDGIYAASETGNITLEVDRVEVRNNGTGVFATAAGNVTATFTDTVVSFDGRGVDLSAGGALTATIGADSWVTGDIGGMRLASGTGTTLTNNGEISSDSGHAIEVSGGAARINNAGELRGTVLLTANGDSIFNTGTWLTSGASDFGAGDDLVDNSALIELRFGETAQTLTFTGLERLTNRGRIDLANGRAGDRLVATSARLDGQGTGVIEMDVDFTTNVADQIEIASATGVTRLDISTIGTIDLTDTFLLVDSTAELVGTEFILTPASETTLVGFDLVYETGGQVRLAAAPTVTAFAPLKTAAAGQRAWTKTAEVWSVRMQQIRDIEALGGREDGIQVWTQAYGGEEEFGQKQVYDLANGPVTRDLTTQTQWFGVQAGVDGVISTEPASFAWGLTAGYGDVRLDFVSHDNLIALDGFNIGAYGGVSAGAFYANALVKLDRFSANADLQEMTTQVDFDGQALGVQGEVGARFDAGGWTVEPQASVAWVKTELDGFEVAGSEIEFDDAISLEGRVGVRVSTTATVGGLKLRTFAGGYAVKEFEGENEMTFTNGGTSVSIKDKPADAYGRIEFGATTQVAPGVHGFIRGEANVGDNAGGFTGRFGASWNW